MSFNVVHRMITFELFFLLVLVVLQHLPTTKGEETLLEKKDNTLVLSDVNIVVLTDVHSWVAGHGIHEPDLNADYGDVLSFYERFRLQCEHNRKDVFFVMNGDFMDGTGLTTFPPEQLTSILQLMPWDAVTIGNHELYHNSTIDYIAKPGGFVDSWGGKYLTSNILYKETNQPIGERFTFLRGTYESSSILTFGFLYNMKDHCANTQVEKVEKVVNSTWFTNALNGNEGEFDAILVLAHMDVMDKLVSVILDRIRFICGNDMPVQFITGHTHIRSFHEMDSYSTSFEAGRYLDTIGFVSFPLKNKSTAGMKVMGAAKPSQSDFFHKYIDGNVESLKKILNVEELETPSGRNMKDQIRKAQKELRLLDVIGCSPMTYHRSSHLDMEDSLWALMIKTIIPDQLFHGDTSKLFLVHRGTLRYDLFEGNVTVNDLFSILPFNDTIIKVEEKITGSEFIEAFGEPNMDDDNDDYYASLPKYLVAGNVELDKRYTLYSIDFDLSYVVKHLEKVLGKSLTALKTNEPNTMAMVNRYITKYWQCEDDDVKEEGVDGTFKWNDSNFVSTFLSRNVIVFLLSILVLVVFFGKFQPRMNYNAVPNSYQLLI